MRDFAIGGTVATEQAVTVDTLKAIAEAFNRHDVLAVSLNGTES
jgi:hypothetical protein|tara:strand:- start:8 stop:139 length:132 start_codon:yes stop_codon:yes gene_type:complete